MRVSISNRRARAAFAAICAVFALMIAAPAGSGAAVSKLRFSKPVRLGPWAGGEPSLAVDANGTSVFVTAPQSGPSGAFLVVNNTPIFSTSSQVKNGDVGVGFWASTDGGRTFTKNANVGTGIGGWDSDVAVGPDHTVYVADLEVAAAAICTSHDGGSTFSSSPLPVDTCHDLVLNHQGPENDREWLTLGKDGQVYLTYHDLTFGFPIIMSSTDHAQTFVPCGSILNPTQAAGANYSPLGGTLVAKPVIGKDGSIYVTVTEPDQVASPVGAALNHVFIAVAKGGCSPSTIFDNHEIYTDPGAEFTLFQSLGIDGAGNLYVTAAGKTKGDQDRSTIWLFTSRDGGATWSAPIRVNRPELKGNVMPTVVGGLGKDQLAVGWFGTPSNGDPNNGKNQWNYYVATSFDGGKTFDQTEVSHGTHYGDVCTDGVFCGLPGFGSNRNLADFASIAVNPKTGCVITAFPGDPWNRPDIDENKNDFESSAYVATQDGGRCLTAASSAVLSRNIHRSTSPAKRARGGALPSTGVDGITLGALLVGVAIALARRLRRVS